MNLLSFSKRPEIAQLASCAGISHTEALGCLVRIACWYLKSGKTDASLTAEELSSMLSELTSDLRIEKYNLSWYLYECNILTSSGKAINHEIFRLDSFAIKPPKEQTLTNLCLNTDSKEVKLESYFNTENPVKAPKMIDKTKERIENLPIPGHLRTEAFLKVWNRWISYRTNRGGRGAKCWYKLFMTHLIRLADFDERSAIDALEYAIKKNWIAFYANDTNPNNHQKNSFNRNTGTANELLEINYDIGAVNASR